MHKGMRKVSSKHLGKVLDHGKPSAPAVMLLAIKAAKGPHCTLNETAVKNEFGMSRRQFQAGIKLLKSTGVLERWQPKHQGFAKERLADAPDDFSILFPESILTESGNVVAFFLAANLSPKPQRPAEIAKRIGIARTATISGIAERAIAFGCSWNNPGPGRKILIARHGFDFAAYQSEIAAKGNLVQIEPSQIEPSQIDAAQLRKREGNSVRENSTQKESRVDIDDFPKERKMRRPTDEDFSRHEEKPKGGDPHLGSSLDDPMLEGYLADGWNLSNTDCPDFQIAHVIREGTDSRVGWALLETDGLKTARYILGALTSTAWHERLANSELAQRNPTVLDLSHALVAFRSLLRQVIGDKPGKWLNSYDLIVKQLYGVASGGEWLAEVDREDVRRMNAALMAEVTPDEIEARERERWARWEALQEKRERERERNREYQRKYRERKKREKMEAKANAA